MPEDYIHGYSPDEQQRLVAQAEVLAPRIFADLDFGGVSRLLEIGCGVGAELAGIHRRWPHLELTGVDRSPRHLAAAQRLLRPLLATGRASLIGGDGAALPFADGRFDSAITIWMLEHVPEPGRILAEALRVLRPDGELICTEVNNRYFAFTPELPAISHWWRQLNIQQLACGGNPFVGGQLYRLAQRLGARDVHTEALPVIDSDREPRGRQRLLDYLQELLLSAAPSLIAAGAVTPAHIGDLKAAFTTARSDTGIAFHYYGVRLRCRPPR